MSLFRLTSSFIHTISSFYIKALKIVAAIVGAAFLKHMYVGGGGTVKFLRGNGLRLAAVKKGTWQIVNFLHILYSC